MMKTEIEFSNFRITVLKALTKHDLKQIFERYYRGTNTKNVRGTGLGMAISRDIVEVMLYYRVKLASAQPWKFI